MGCVEEEAVAMHDLPVEEVGHRGEGDVGVGAHVDSSAGWKLRRPHVIEENEGTQEPALRLREHASWT